MLPLLLSLTLFGGGVYQGSIYGDAQDNALAGGGTVGGNLTVTGDTSLAGSTVTGTLVGSCPTASGAHGYILDINGIQGCVLNSNIAATGFVIHPEDNFPAGSQVAAAIAIRGGLDEENITMTRANCSTKTVTVVTTDYTATYTTTVFTEDGVGGTSTTWNRGATDATAATNLTAKINALHGTAGVSATASTNVISVKPDTKTMSVSIATSDGTCAAIASTTDAPVNLFGQVNIAGSASSQVHYALFQPTVGLSLLATGKLLFGALGGFTGLNADGEVSLLNNAQTSGLLLGSTSSTTNKPSIGNAGNSNLYLRVGGGSGSVNVQDNSGSTTASTISGLFVNNRSTAYLAGAGTNATATLATTGLSATFLNGTHYNVDFLAMFNDSTAADGIQFDFNGGTGTITDLRIECVIDESGQVAQDTVTETTALATVINKATLVGTGAAYMHCVGGITPSSSGTFIPRYAQNTHSAGTATLQRGSYLRLDNLP